MILRHSHLFAKLPGDAKRVAWHQDASYWPLSPSRVVTAWLAIDDVNLYNSAMQVIPRSHHHAQLAFRDSTTAENSVLVQTVDDHAGHWASHSRPPGETIPTAVNRHQHPHHPRPLNSDPPR